MNHDIRLLNFFRTGTTLNFKGRLETKNGPEIFVKALDIEFEQD